MGLTPGSRLGAYEIVGLIGVGGMGEVYRARDTHLDRHVAIKSLPDAVRADPERATRFEREAKLLATLNHPNIATIHGLEHANGDQFIVMELVEGETLAERIARGPLPLDEALPIARQIAEALEAAHEQGIIHRDLKPANIKVRADGTVKVLDFGLAKAITGDGSAQSALLTNSPTITSPVGVTGVGVLLGTAAYMAPEQARGKGVDKRADIWAFGCVLYEMLIGRPAFTGSTAVDTIAAVLTKPPDLSLLPPNTPAPLRRLLRRILEPAPNRRLRDIADARLELDEADGQSSSTVSPVIQSRRAVRFSLAWVAIVLAVAAVAFFAGRRWRAPQTSVVRTWRGERLAGPAIAMAPTVSPNGESVAFTAVVDGQSQVAVLRAGAWAVLTHERTRGGVAKMAWAKDSSRIYYDRLFGSEQSIFSVSALGGDERPVLENASAPRVLPDQSLIVVRRDAQQHWRLHRFWPDTRRIEELNGFAATQLAAPTFEPFPDGKEVAIFGRPADKPDMPDHLYAVDVNTGASRRLAPTIAFRTTWVFPLATTADRVLFDRPSDVHDIVSVPRDGRDSVETLVSLTTLPQNLAVGPDGSLYVDQSFTPPEAVLYRHADRHVDARIPTPITSAGGAAAYWTALPTRDPRILVALEGNKSRIMVVRPQSAAIPEPFMDTQEDTSGPVTIVGNDQVALLLGRPPNRVVAVATTDGHLVRRFAKDEIDGDAVDGLAATPDGRDLYVASNGAIAVVPVTGGTPRRVTGGVSVAVDPGGRYLVVERSTPSETQLARVDIATGAETAIPLDARFNLPPYQFAYGANPIAHDGRLVVRVATRDSWFWPSGILDPRTGQVELIDVGVPLDMFSGGWLPDGRVMTFATPTFSSLWRFRAEDPTP